jgi:hypothetical protein
VVRSPDGAPAARGGGVRQGLRRWGLTVRRGGGEGDENGDEQRRRRLWGALDGDGCGSLHKELG